MTEGRKAVAIGAGEVLFLVSLALSKAGEGKTTFSMSQTWRKGGTRQQAIDDAVLFAAKEKPGFGVWETLVAEVPFTPPSASIPADVEREAMAIGERVALRNGGLNRNGSIRAAAAAGARAALAARPSTPQANDAPSILDRTPRTHPYKPHAKFPWFCDLCGYAEHERLQHPAPATPKVLPLSGGGE